LKYKILLPLIVLFLFSHHTASNAQTSADTNSAARSKDSLKIYETNPVEVTSTRTDKLAEDSPIPVSVIGKKEITSSGSYKLSDILFEQAGLAIDYFLGAGVQMQGLDPDYALILIDGEPLVGRNGGTIDLTRVTLGNVKQIEVVKGPSSSLYGSEALSGVINIITDKPKELFGTNLRTRYGTHNTYDINGDISLIKNNFSGYLFLNYNHSDGYDLFPESVSQTSPLYNNYTVNPVLKFRLSSKADIELNSRFYNEKYSNTTTILFSNNVSVNYDDVTKLNDFNNALSFNYQLSNKSKLKTKFYNTYYDFNNTLTRQSNGVLFEEDKFQQIYSKGEILLEGNYFKNNLTVIGGGIILDKVIANRIYNGERSANNKYGFIQNEFLPMKNLNVTLGVRIDAHSDYSSRVSPKLSVLYRPAKFITLKSSYGTGFKAPTFQQLYLDFTNPQVGYSVFGTYNFKESIQQLINNGEISEMLININSVAEIKPENSQAVNFNISLHPFEQIKVEANFFRNDITDLIDVQSVAKKTNGQRVFTYFNINKIFTQGVETNLSLSIIKNLNITFGYQYLDAEDKQVIEDIEAGKIAKIGSTGLLRPVQLVEYGGLFGRSKHSGVVKVNYSFNDDDILFSLRTILKGRYGYIDRNSNLILDADNEYAPGYVLWNSSISKKVIKNFSVQLGVDNIFDYTNPDYTPEFPGRIIYTTLNYKF